MVSSKYINIISCKFFCYILYFSVITFITSWYKVTCNNSNIIFGTFLPKAPAYIFMLYVPRPSHPGSPIIPTECISFIWIIFICYLYYFLFLHKQPHFLYSSNNFLYTPAFLHAGLIPYSIFSINGSICQSSLPQNPISAMASRYL